MNADGEIAPQHYAFLVDEKEFDEIFGRVRERSLPYWADPAQTQAGEINQHDGGRGFYFEDPDGHFLEVITRPYGSGGPIADSISTSQDLCKRVSAYCLYGRESSVRVEAKR